MVLLKDNKPSTLDTWYCSPHVDGWLMVMDRVLELRADNLLLGKVGGHVAPRRGAARPVPQNSDGARECFCH